MDTRQASREVKRLFEGDNVVQNCGRNAVMGELVWEIWVEGEDGKMATRFLLDDGGDRAKDGFDIIEKLFAHLNFIHKGIEDKLKDALENNELKRTKIAHELELNEPPPN